MNERALKAEIARLERLVRRQEIQIQKLKTSKTSGVSIKLDGGSLD